MRPHRSPAAGPGAGTAAGPRPRVQRFAAYGLVTDPAGRVLLTRIAAGYPGAGRWHLPGGGTDFGEDAGEGLLRELAEETDQRGRVDGLIGVSHRHNPAAMGPEGVPDRLARRPGGVPRRGGRADRAARHRGRGRVHRRRALVRPGELRDAAADRGRADARSHRTG